jgi:hypothetical protein
MAARKVAATSRASAGSTFRGLGHVDPITSHSSQVGPFRNALKSPDPRHDPLSNQIYYRAGSRSSHLERPWSAPWSIEISAFCGLITVDVRNFTHDECGVFPLDISSMMSPTSLRFELREVTPIGQPLPRDLDPHPHPDLLRRATHHVGHHPHTLVEVDKSDRIGRGEVGILRVVFHRERVDGPAASGGTPLQAAAEAAGTYLCRRKRCSRVASQKGVLVGVTGGSNLRGCSVVWVTASPPFQTRWWTCTRGPSLSHGLRQRRHRRPGGRRTRREAVGRLQPEGTCRTCQDE